MQLLLVAGVGRDVGKTALGERLARLLTWGLGARVAVVKHVHHGVDYRVKDTGRYLSAGAARVVAVGPGEFMVVEKGALGLWEAVSLAAAGADVVVVEGFRGLVGEVVEAGGCAVVLEDRVGILYPTERLVLACTACLEAAVEEALRLLRRGLCGPPPQLLRSPPQGLCQG